LLFGIATLSLEAPSAGAILTLGRTVPASPENAWADGSAFGRTLLFVHTAYASDCPPPSGKCATDSGPYEGVFWRRGDLGSPPSWSPPRRVSQRRKQASRPSLAASGTHVYVAWVTRTSYLHPRRKAARVLWVRESADEGSHWESAVRISPLRRRVDFPVLAASGERAWLTWTNARSGAIRLATTTDAGAHWARETIGTTRLGKGTAEGFRGFPSVGVNGTNLVVAWIANGRGRLVALTSNDLGSSWNAETVPTELLATGPHGANDYPAVRGADDGASTNVAIAYATSDGIAARLFDGTTLTDPSVVEGPWPVTISGRVYDNGYGPAVVPFGAAGIVVAWAGCVHEPALSHPCRSSKSARIDILEAETPDGGTTWPTVGAVAVATRSAPINEAPSVEADVSGARWFVWLARAAKWSDYRLQDRASGGSGG
jgi:hypothetical protein